jgi:hypothetical protein
MLRQHNLQIVVMAMKTRTHHCATQDGQSLMKREIESDARDGINRFELARVRVSADMAVTSEGET